MHTHARRVALLHSCTWRRPCPPALQVLTACMALQAVRPPSWLPAAVRACCAGLMLPEAGGQHGR